MALPGVAAPRRMPATWDAQGETPSYPQREAVLWALRELTGEDAGTRSDDWYQYLLQEWLTQEP